MDRQILMENYRIILWSWVKRLKKKDIVNDLRLKERTVEGHLRQIRDWIMVSAGSYEGQLAGAVHVDTWTYEPKFSRTPPKRPMLLGMMDSQGHLRLFVIPSKHRESIYPLIKAHVRSGSLLITDESKIYTGLRKDGFPKLKQVKDAQFDQVWPAEKRGQSLFHFWKRVSDEIYRVRAVRDTNFLPRVRETELRWQFQGQPAINLYRHMLDSMYF